MSASSEQDQAEYDAADKAYRETIDAGGSPDEALMAAAYSKPEMTTCVLCHRAIDSPLEIAAENYRQARAAYNEALANQSNYLAADLQALEMAQIEAEAQLFAVILAPAEEGEEGAVARDEALACVVCHKVYGDARWIGGETFCTVCGYPAIVFSTDRYPKDLGLEAAYHTITRDQLDAHALGRGWDRANARRHELIDIKNGGVRTLTGSEVTEFENLQRLADLKRESLSSPSLPELEAIAKRLGVK